MPSHTPRSSPRGSKTSSARTCGRWCIPLPGRSRTSTARFLSLPDQIGAREEGCLTTILSEDMWRHQGADYREHLDKMSRGLRTWLERGRDIKAEDYRAALDLRAQLIADVWEALRDYDYVVTLATTDIPPLCSEGTGSRAPQRLWNLIGCPAISGPIGKIGRLPVGLQIVSRPGVDAALLDFAGHVFRGTEDASPTAAA